MLLVSVYQIFHLRSNFFIFHVFFFEHLYRLNTFHIENRFFNNRINYRVALRKICCLGNYIILDFNHFTYGLYSFFSFFWININQN